MANKINVNSVRDKIYNSEIIIDGHRCNDKFKSLRYLPARGVFVVIDNGKKTDSTGDCQAVELYNNIDLEG